MSDLDKSYYAEKRAAHLAYGLADEARLAAVEAELTPLAARVYSGITTVPAFGDTGYNPVLTWINNAAHYAGR